MDVADGGGDPLNERLASCLGILVSLDQFLQSVPTAFGAVEVHDLEPARLGVRSAWASARARAPRARPRRRSSSPCWWQQVRGGLSPIQAAGLKADPRHDASAPR